MTHSDYDEETGPRPAHELRHRAALLSVTSWRNAAFLFGVFVIAGIGNMTLWSTAGNRGTNETLNSNKTDSLKKYISANQGSSTASSQNETTGKTKTELIVNGRSITLPASGVYRSSTSDGNSNSTLDVSVNNQSSGPSNSSTTSINFQSNTANMSDADDGGVHPPE